MLNPRSNTGATSGDIAELAQVIMGGNFPFWYPLELASKAIDPYTYPLDALPLVAGSVRNLKVTIESNSAFFLCDQSMVVTDPNDESTFIANPAILVTLKDAGSGTLLSPEAVHAVNYFGTAQWPYKHSVPRLWAPTSSLLLEVRSLAAVDYNVRFSFNGIKVYDFNKA